MMVDLEAEFMTAIDRAVAADIDHPFSRAMQWGIETVETYGHERRLYEPIEGGRWAIIAPVVEGNGDELTDLCAIDPVSCRWSTRLGLGQGLGFVEIESARWRSRPLSWRGENLLIVETGVEWLIRPVGSAYLFDIGKVVQTLDGVDEFECSTQALADRVAAYLPPSERRRVGVRV